MPAAKAAPRAGTGSAPSKPQAQAFAASKGGFLPIQPLKPQYVSATDSGLPLHQSQTVIHKPILIPQSGVASLESKSLDDSLASSNRQVTLDGFILLEASGVSVPEDSRQAALVDRKLSSVLEEDLFFFTGLVFLDVSENQLELKPFGAIPRLKELRLACNNIQKIDEILGFEKLLVLDLSYNKLTVRSVQALEQMPRLRELDLSGNSLRGLPLELYRLSALEKLILDNNKIDDNSVFSILCTLPSLRTLGLAYNFLWRIPPECCAEGYFR